MIETLATKMLFWIIGQDVKELHQLTFIVTILYLKCLPIDSKAHDNFPVIPNTISKRLPF